MKRAVALGYQAPNAPRLLAKGEGNLAILIQKEACEAGIPIWKDPVLADSLSRLGLGQEIPKELYLAVSIVFRTLFQKKKNN